MVYEYPPSLNESPKSIIVGAGRKGDREVEVEVVTQFDEEQFRYFSEHEKNIITDLNSTKARVGVDQKRISEFAN